MTSHHPTHARYKTSIVICAQRALLVLSSGLLVACAAPDQRTPTHTSSIGERLECRWNPDACLYEGQYELGEEAYAEQRARELNQAQSRRVKRRSIWGW